MERPAARRFARLLLLLLLLLPPPVLGRRSAAPSRLRLLPPCWPRRLLDESFGSAGQMAEKAHCNTVESWLAGKQPRLILASQLDPRALPRHRLVTQHHNSSRSGPAAQRALHRGKRHAAACLLRAQLMRVGCVLGTCQVHHLRHRLWQLKGRSRSQDSSPMNPNSPHSYG